MTPHPNRRAVLAAGAAALGGLAAPRLALAAARTIIVAEPVHLVAYLPLYLAKHKGFFADEGLDLQVLTIDSGAGHTNAVLTGQAFAFIGGPEHCAFAKLKGAELRCVCNVVDRSNNYFVSRKGTAPQGRDFAGFVRGKTVATGLFGGTPNSTTRFLANEWGLDLRKDMTLSELVTPAIFAAVRARAADIAMITEPLLTQGVQQGLWDEPWFNAPREFGPYAYSTLNVRLDTLQNDPAVVTGFVRAVMRGLKSVYADPAEAADFARREWPTTPAADLRATLDRTFADSLWSRDGVVSQASWDAAQKVVRSAGVLKSEVPYDAIIDMQVQQHIAATI